MAGPIALDVIVNGIKLMELCPVPPLQVIAKTLISIWEAVKLVGVRLTFNIYIYLLLSQLPRYFLILFVR